MQDSKGADILKPDRKVNNAVSEDGDGVVD